MNKKGDLFICVVGAGLLGGVIAGKVGAIIGMVVGVLLYVVDSHQHKG